jgi:D-glycero-alpha-D-manno-heptose-7-phosphate kinase
VERGLVRAKAPLRVSFAGGGTDVPPYPQREGGLVLSATINRYAHATLRPRDDRQVCVQSRDYGLSLDFDVAGTFAYDGKLDLVKAALSRFTDPLGRGFDLFLRAGAPPGSGLGSSSAVMVSLVGLLERHYHLAMTDYEIAQLAFQLEREDLGIRGGLQDHYAATFGGFNFMEFEPDRVVVNPLRIDPDTVYELEHNMLLCYTGRPRLSDGIIDDQVARYEDKEPETLDGLRAQKDLARAMKNALLRRQHDEFGVLLGEAWQQKRRMSPRIATPFIDEAYETACAHGALGGKVTGAGGGGYLVLYCRFDRIHRVAEALTALGLAVSEFAFEQAGLVTWRAGG